jgi:hypothetical protein
MEQGAAPSRTRRGEGLEAARRSERQRWKGLVFKTLGAVLTLPLLLLVAPLLVSTLYSLSQGRWVAFLEFGGCLLVVLVPIGITLRLFTRRGRAGDAALRKRAWRDAF